MSDDNDLFSRVVKPELKTYSVAELTHKIKYLLEDEVGSVWTEGELSNVNYQSSGHIYFSLKDEKAVISCALFKGNQRNLKIELKQGMKVKVFGELSVFAPRGSYQIIVRSVEAVGVGTLQQQFEQLKEKLQKEGLFDESAKAKLPVNPDHIGVITSPTGAAVRDIISALTRRKPSIHITLCPAKVQGEGAAVEIADAIQTFNENYPVELIIVGRGGGSLEDLWAFNEEIVARAIAKSTIPVISSVGHQTDFSVSDFVADVRAQTPSTAAELAVPDFNEVLRQVKQQSDRLISSLEHMRLRLRNRFISASRSYAFKEPQNMLIQKKETLKNMRKHMANSLEKNLQQSYQMLDEYDQGFKNMLSNRLLQDKYRLDNLDKQIKLMNPTAILQRGFSLTRTRSGAIVKQADELGAGDEIVTQLARGTVESTVKNCRK